VLARVKGKERGSKVKGEMHSVKREERLRKGTIPRPDKKKRRVCFKSYEEE